MSRFIIITPGRSGSTFLARTLDGQPDLFCEEEIFHRSEHYPGSFNAFLRSNTLYRCVGFFFNRERLSTRSINLPLAWLLRRFLNQKA